MVSGAGLPGVPEVYRGVCAGDGRVPKGTRKHIEQTRHVRLEGLTVEDIDDVRVTTRAVDSFRYHHGGGIREAEVQLRSMLEDFILESARKVTETGFVQLTREGFCVVLSPERVAVVGYSTVHRERTWEQVKAGVRSRISRKHPRPGDWAGTLVPVPEQGPPVPVDAFEATAEPESIFLSARVRRSYTKIEGIDGDWDENLDAAIRKDFAEFPYGTVARREKDGMFEVTVNERVWLVSPDVRSLIGVKVHRPECGA